MALNKSLTPIAESNFINGQLGKYSSQTIGVVANVGFDPSSVDSDPSALLELSELVFFYRLDRLRNLRNDSQPYNQGQSYVPAKDTYAYLTYFKQFNDHARKFVVFNRTATESFLDTTQQRTDTANVIATNASFYGFTSASSGYTGAFFDPLPPNEIVVTGKVYHNGSVIPNVASTASTDGFHVQHDGSGNFNFGQGDASSGDGIGALTPILLFNTTFNKVWKYGEKNIYTAGHSGIERGDPGAAAEHIIVRSSAQYEDQNDPASGKNIFAYHPGRDVVLIISQDDVSGASLDYYRDNLFRLGFHFAVGFDGSNSVMLYEYSTKTFHVKPAIHKYNSNIIGVVLKAQ